MPLDRSRAHYLYNVMRVRPGDEVEIFDGSSGTWSAEVPATGRKDGLLRCRTRVAPQRLPPDLWLLFAPLRKTRTDYIVEKATELGVARLFPVRTEFTTARRVRKRRLVAHAVEAAEQCGGNYVPTVDELQALETLLDSWPGDRQLLFCDESLAGMPAGDLSTLSPGKWAILTGPEGGFSRRESARISAMPNTVAMGLGPRILRADTAAVAALSLWQCSLGDWRAGQGEGG